MRKQIKVNRRVLDELARVLERKIPVHAPRHHLIPSRLQAR